MELAGALAEIASDTLRRDFRSINPPEAQIILVEALDPYSRTTRRAGQASARRQLEKLGVTVAPETRVTDITEHEVVVEPAAGGAPERIPSRTMLWAAGVQTSSFSARRREGSRGRDLRLSSAGSACLQSGNGATFSNG